MCVCVRVNSCALRTSQAPISFVSVIPAGVFQLPSSMLLEQTIEFARGQSAKKTAKVSKRMMFSETHVLPMTVCISGSRISKKWDQFSIIHAYSACIHVKCRSWEEEDERGEAYDFVHCVSRGEVRKMTTSEILPEFPRSDFSQDLFNFRACRGCQGSLQVWH